MKKVEYEKRKCGRIPSKDDPYYPFYEALKNDGQVWRDDKSNNIKEWLTLDHPGIQGHAENIQFYGWKDLSLEHETKTISEGKNKDGVKQMTPPPFPPFFDHHNILPTGSTISIISNFDKWIFSWKYSGSRKYEVLPYLFNEGQKSAIEIVLGLDGFVGDYEFTFTKVQPLEKDLTNV